MSGEGLMAYVENEQWSEAESEMVDASSAELYKLWQNAAYLKERARFLLKTKHGVILR
jgi:hypothetical protein